MIQDTFHIVGTENGDYDDQMAKLFGSYGWQHRKALDAETLVFTGGHDVSPGLYNEEPLACTHYSARRDEYEMDMYYRARDRGQKCVGICRGGQFLHVMNGGRMWQDVDGHATGKSHVTLDILTGEYHEVTSTHHQMMAVDDVTNPKNAFKVVALAQESTRRRAQQISVVCNGHNGNKTFTNDVEVLWYPEQQTLSFQPHPEYSNRRCTTYFNKLMVRFGFLTIRPEYLKDNFIDPLEDSEDYLKG